MTTSEAAPMEAGAAQQAFGPYVTAVRHHWVLVAIITLAAFALAAVSLARAGSKYSSSASVLVTPLPEGDAVFTGIGTVVDTGDPARTVQTAAALVDTPDAAARAAARLGRPWTTQSVLNAVSVAPRGASDVLAVTAQAASPADAQHLANAFATQAVAFRAEVVQAQIASSIKQLESQLAALGHSTSPEVQTLASGIEQLRAAQGTGREPTMSVSQTAQSAVRSGASPKLILLLAIVGGFALASVAAVVLETFGGPVRDREEIERLFPVPVLAAIQDIPGRTRVSGLPPWELPPMVFEQLRMLRVQLSLMEGGTPVIMVTSPGAGDGKTTVAASLAAAFAEAGKQVILMDLDLRKPDIPRLLKAERPDRSQENAAPAGVPLLGSALAGVRVMPAPEGDLKSFELLTRRLPMLLDQAKRAADVVIIDTAPVGEVSEALSVALLCNHVVVVVRPRHTDRRRLIFARDLLVRAGAPITGLVLVGKEVGLPRGDQSYAYALQSPNPPPSTLRLRPTGGKKAS